MSEKTEEKYRGFRHIWLYAKDWYMKDDDPWKDLRKIVSKEVAMQEEAVTEGNVFDVVIDVALIAIQQSGNVDHTLRSIFSSLFSRNKYHREDPFHEPEDYVLLELLSVIRLAKIIDDDGKVLINLGEPDPDILPLSETAKAESSEENPG